MQDVDAFIKANERWLGDEVPQIDKKWVALIQHFFTSQAIQTLKSMSGVDQRRVITAGTMSGAWNHVFDVFVPSLLSDGGGKHQSEILRLP